MKIKQWALVTSLVLLSAKSIAAYADGFSEAVVSGVVSGVVGALSTSIE